MKRPSTARWRRFLVLIGALVVGLAPAVAAPTVAAADGPFSPFCWVRTENGVYVRVFCRPIQIQLVRWPDWPECPQCGLTFLWREYPAVLPESVENSINETIVSGLVTLGQAAAATNPSSREGLRAEAMRMFTAAARSSLGTWLSLQGVGVADPVTNTIDTTPQQWHSWLQAAGQNVADGMVLLKQYLQSPVGLPAPAALLARAAAEFDAAYTGLSQQVVIYG